MVAASGMEWIFLAAIRQGELEIDLQGCIWRRQTHRGNVCPRRRAEKQTPQGYLQLRKMIDGRRYHVCAHRVVWCQTKGPIPGRLTVNHKNGLKDDNRPDNLELATYSENMRHAHRVGLLDQRGEKNPAAKLTDNEVVQIRLSYKQGTMTMATLADRFGISFQQVSKLIRGERRASALGTTENADHRHIACPRNPITGQFESFPADLQVREYPKGVVE